MKEAPSLGVLPGGKLAASLKLNQALGTDPQKASHTNPQDTNSRVSRTGLQSGEFGGPKGLLIPEERASC